jgi:outer membrane protein OmpA-like peptidoglycan-associated protein
MKTASFLLLVLALSACQSPAPPAPGPAAATTAPAAAAAPAPTPAPAPAPAAPPPPIRPYDEAVLAAATQLFGAAPAPAGTTTLLIDPLIDGVTGAQTRATQDMGTRLAELVKSRYPNYQVQRFSAANVQRAPVVLIGTFTGVNAQRQTSGERSAYRICLALIDLKTGRILSKGLAFADPKGVDPTPLLYYQDSPANTEDPPTLGYIRTCQGTKPGEPINPQYVDRVFAAAQIAEGIEAYNARRYADALALYEAAARAPAGGQLRVYNGLYLANARLGRRAAADEAFAQLVRYSLEHKLLAVKFLFRPGTAAFVSDPAVAGPYPDWLRQIAQQTVRASVCLEVVGHTSATGAAVINERLSLLRAEEIKRRLEADAPALTGRLVARGAGSGEMKVGNGRDDASDALDRRVEFVVFDCGKIGGRRT